MARLSPQAASPAAPAAHLLHHGSPRRRRGRAVCHLYQPGESCTLACWHQSLRARKYTCPHCALACAAGLPQHAKYKSGRPLCARAGHAHGIQCCPCHAPMQACWLLGVCGAPTQLPKQAANPNAALAALMGAAQRLGFSPPAYPPDRLHGGYGPEASAFLSALAQAALEARGYDWQPHVYPAAAAAGRCTLCA